MKNLLRSAVVLLLGNALSIHAQPTLAAPAGRPQMSQLTPPDGGYGLQPRGPSELVDMKVDMWDLGYMDLGVAGNSKCYSISTGEKKSTRACGTLSIMTDKLATCSALAIAGSGGALLGHFPPAFCQYLAGGKIDDKDWAKKSKTMKEKLTKTLTENKAALSGGKVVIVKGYVSAGDTAETQLKHLVESVGISPAPVVVQSHMGETELARSVKVVKDTSGVHILVDGNPT
ncbi:hypothetical protein ANO11243_071230 [Dothideomycetidae sp. 11243]|nr:hypothetical protein ANO11243_071230 [fungal sp. No.11243]